MKLGAWVCSATDDPGIRALRLAALLIGLPFLLTFLFFWYRAFDTPAPVPVATVERWIEPLNGSGFDTARFTALARQTPDFSQARWETIALPNGVPVLLVAESLDSSPQARIWMRARITPPDNVPAPAQPVVYVSRVVGGAWSVSLDGRLIATNLDNWRMQWNTPLYVKLPPGSLIPGKTAVIDIAFPVSVPQGYAFGTLYVGDAVGIDRLYEMRMFWQDTLPKAAVLIVLLLGLLALHYWLGEHRDQAYLRLAFACIVWAIGNSMYFGDFSADDASLWFGVLNAAATHWMACALALFAIHFDPDRWPRLEAGLVAYAALMTVVILPVWRWNVYALSLQYYANVVVAVGVLGYFSWRSIKAGSHEFRIIKAAVWSVPLMALHTIYFVADQRDPDGIEIYPYSAFIVLRIGNSTTFPEVSQHLPPIVNRNFPPVFPPGSSDLSWNPCLFP